ncbi:MAG: hypothetical protein JSS90_05135 [Bacteroidetes bacterium]|nr:hypothetical protein [Bacteroidota bacterium]
MRITFRMVLVVSSAVAILTAGIVIFFQVTNSTKSKAKTTTATATAKPVDFNVPELKTDFEAQTIQGSRVRNIINTDNNKEEK